MAEVFDSDGVVCTTSFTTIYTCPAGTTTLVTMLQATNVGAVARKVSAQWVNASKSSAVTRLASDVELSVGSACGLIDGKLSLKGGDTIQVKASAATDVEITISFLEISA